MAYLNGHLVVLSEHMTDTVNITIKRTFKPGVRKGKHADKLTKMYVLESYQVPSESCLLVDRRVVMHPALWSKVKAELEKLNNPQMSYGWR